MMAPDSAGPKQPNVPMSADASPSPPLPAGGAAVMAPASRETDAQAALGALSVLLHWAGQGFALKEAHTGRYLQANTVLLGWMGRLAVEVLGRTDAELFDAATATALRAADQAALQQGEPMAATHRLGADGHAGELAVWRAVLAAPGSRQLLSLWSDPAAQRAQAAQLHAALSQIEQLQRANESLRRELADQPLRDGASGLYTRAHFEDQLRREADLSTREHREFSIVFIEIDTAAGPAAAAQAPGPRRARQPAELAAVQSAAGRVLRAGTRAMDAACRFDDRRFALLLSGVGLATAHSRMEGLRRRCATEVVVHGGVQFNFTVSMGVASFPHTANTQADLLQACTSALQEGQRRGGNHVALAAIRLAAAHRVDDLQADAAAPAQASPVGR